MDKETKTPPKKPTKLSELPEKQQAYALLRESGVDIKTAGKALSVATQTAYNMEHKVKHLIKDDSKLISLARRNLKKLAQGKKYGEIKQVKDSTSLAAVNAILDRADPIIKHIETKSISFNVNYDVESLK
jgi:hypothetical protein